MLESYLLVHHSLGTYQPNGPEDPDKFTDNNAKLFNGSFQALVLDNHPGYLKWGIEVHPSKGSLVETLRNSFPTNEFEVTDGFVDFLTPKLQYEIKVKLDDSLDENEWKAYKITDI